jgi:hypothetical protein
VAKFIPVEPEKWAEMVKALAQVERLKAEVAEARKGSGEGMKVMLGLSDELVAENARLKAEVNYWRIEAETDHARWLRVLEDNERLRKAGDALIKEGNQMIIDYETSIRDSGTTPPRRSPIWINLVNAAKDGKAAE